MSRLSGCLDSLIRLFFRSDQLRRVRRAAGVIQKVLLLNCTGSPAKGLFGPIGPEIGSYEWKSPNQPSFTKKSWFFLFFLRSVQRESPPGQPTKQIQRGSFPRGALEPQYIQCPGQVSGPHLFSSLVNCDHICAEKEREKIALILVELIQTPTHTSWAPAWLVPFGITLRARQPQTILQHFSHGHFWTSKCET